MIFFQFLKGAFRKMKKALLPHGSSGDSILGKRKYILRDISRSHIELPSSFSVLSVTKYFEDEDSDIIETKKKSDENDW